MPLTPGSIAFTGFNADGNDDIAFVALEEIAAGTVIYFSDREWQGSAFNTGEGEVRFTASQTIPAGTIVTITSYSSAPTSNLGTLSGASGVGNSDEIIYAFVGAPNMPTTFLAAIANSGFAVDGGTLAGTGLVVSQTAIDLAALGGSPDIAAFNAARTGQASFANYAAIINTASNWISQDAGGDQSNDTVAPNVPFATTPFVLGAPPTETQTVGFAAASLSVGQAEGNNGTTAYTFTVERTGGTTGALTVTGSFAQQTTDLADFGGTLPGGFSTVIAAGATSATVTVSVTGDTTFEANETFGLAIASASNSAGVATSVASAAANATATITNDDVAGPPFGGITILDQAESLAGSTTVPAGSDAVQLVRLGSIQGTGTTAAGRAEAVSFDATTGQAFTTNAAQTRVDAFRIGSDGALSATGSIDLNALPDSGGVNSVAVRNGIVAVAYESETAGQPGHVSLYDSATLTLIKTLNVGVLPDQLTFSPDGSKLLVANEGETLSAANNPAGSVSIIDLSAGAAAATVLNTIGFSALNGSEAGLKAAGLNLFPGQPAGSDIEPEYIAVSPDGTRAYVTLQEVNAVAVIDLTDTAADRPLAILPLGAIDRTLAGNAFDPSDRDGISLESADVASLLQPDAIASYAVGGVTYFVTANEGDSRVGVTDEVRLSEASYVLDPTAYPNAAALKDANALGRLTVIRTAGDTDGDGDIDQITTYGGRGISIFRQNADGTIDKVRETGGEFEAIFAANFPALFNTENGGGLDSRSDNKGPEPEGVTIGAVGGRTYAFVTLERVGGVITYDVTDPANAAYVGYTPATAQDYAPEVVTFVSAADSPTGQALVLSANEVSGTLTVYAVDALTTQNGTADGETLTGTASRDRLFGLGGNDTLTGLGGDDLLDGGAGNDRLDGGAGFDTVTYASASAGVNIRLDLKARETGQGIDTFVGIEGVIGSAFNDTIYGDGANNRLDGGAGADRIVGGAGSDVIVGGAGRDTMTGGTGADTFVFLGLGDFDQTGLTYGDKIDDFSQADGDKIDLSALGDLSFIGTAAFSGSGAGEVRYIRGNSSPIQIDVNGDGIVDAVIQIGRFQFTAGDFIL